MRKVRFYVVLGITFLIIETIFVLWSYLVVTSYGSISAESQLPQEQHQRKSKHNRKSHHSRPPDGRFNGYPVFYHDLTIDQTYHSRPYSSVRCTGENYQGDDFAWMHRSCHFRFLCFNVSSREFEVYARPDDETLQSIIARPLFMDMSASIIPPPRVRDVGHDDENYHKMGDGVSLGSGVVRHPKDKFDGDEYDRDRSRRLKNNYNWFPTVVQSLPPERYYALEEDMVFVPFHSILKEMGGNRSREYSVIWDDLFPIYTLLNMFQLTALNASYEALLMRYIPQGRRMSKSMRSLRKDDHRNLQRRMDPFRPLMMRHGTTDDGSLGRRRDIETNWTSQTGAILMSSVTPTWPKSPHQKMVPLQSGLVCAKDAVGGLGPYGIRYMTRGNVMNIYHNYGKGDLLWKFRNYCIDNLRLSTSASSLHGKSDVENSSRTIRITLSTSPISTSQTSEDGTPVRMNSNIFDLTQIEKEVREFMSTPNNHSEWGSNKKVNAGSKGHHRSSTDGRPIEVESHDFSVDKINMRLRAKLMMDTTVFIATCSEATASAAIFLPRGATIVVVHNINSDSRDDDGRMGENFDDRTRNSVSSLKLASACLDYRDLLNNLSHVFVHWFPVSETLSKKDREALYGIVKQATIER